MKIVVKIGGTLLDSEGSREQIAHQIADAFRMYRQMVVVHGGGRQLTQFLAERGIESRFVNGLRVTTPETLDAVLKILAGTVNHQLVASLNAVGSKAVGLSGIDAGLVEAEQLDPELGAVGRVTRSCPALLEALLHHGYLPVIACVAGDRKGHIYNVNADQMAVACAVGFGASRLIFLTDVAGVLGREGKVLAELTADEGEQLVADALATGGMQAKLTAAASALRQGIAQVYIAPGAEGCVLERVLMGDPVGTRVVLSKA